MQREAEQLLAKNDRGSIFTKIELQNLKKQQTRVLGVSLTTIMAPPIFRSTPPRQRPRAPPRARALRHSWRHSTAARFAALPMYRPRSRRTSGSGNRMPTTPPASLQSSIRYGVVPCAYDERLFGKLTHSFIRSFVHQTKVGRVHSKSRYRCTRNLPTRRHSERGARD